VPKDPLPTILLLQGSNPCCLTHFLASFQLSWFGAVDVELSFAGGLITSWDIACKVKGVVVKKNKMEVFN
jgi:hypothetical protein